MEHENSQEDRKGGIQAVEIAGLILDAMCGFRQPAQLKEIAAAVGMPPAKVHRYITSLVRVGLAEQDERTSLYSLGHMAIRLGIAAIERNDVVNRAGTLLKGICLQMKTSGHLSIWGERGPVVIRNEHGGPPIISTLGLGAATPLLRSATGRSFLTYLPRQATEHLLQNEMRAINFRHRDVEQVIEETLKRGYARISEGLIPGLFAISCPVFGVDGSIQCSLTFISTDRLFFDDGGEAVQLAVTAIGELNARYGRQMAV